ncbi:MAG: hypothetical protein RR605_06610 [Acinetobacter sp.]
MKSLLTIICIFSLFLTACNKQVDKDFSGEWIQVPKTENSVRKLFIEKSGNDYQIKDEFWLNQDSTRPSTSSEAIAEVSSDGSLKYKNLKTIEFQLNSTSDQLVLHDKSYDAKVTFEKAN